MLLITVLPVSSWGAEPMWEEDDNTTLKPFKLAGAQRLAGYQQHFQPTGFIPWLSS